MATGIGGAVAQGLESGFSMGQRFDDAQERKRATGVAEARTAKLDTERSAELARNNAQEDEDRQLKALEDERAQHAYLGAGLAHQYGGLANIPESEGKAYATKANEISTRRANILRTRYAPIVEKEQQWAKDTASRLQTGQLQLESLSDGDFVRLIQGTGLRPASDYVAPQGGKSAVRQNIDDTTAGIETQNEGLITRGANGLLGPEIQTGLGHVAPDGSEIVKKELAALVPAPATGQPQQPVNPMKGLMAALNSASMPSSPAPAAAGGEPGAAGEQTQAEMQAGDGSTVMPVLRVTARHPDGTEVSYHAPITKGRGTGPDDEVHPGFKMADAMDRMGKLSVLETLANTPAGKAKIERGLKELGPRANGFLGAYYAMHGDAKALLPPGSEDPTSKKIGAIQQLAKQQGITFAEAARQLDGKGASGKAGALQQKLDAIDSDEDLTPAEKAKAKRVAYGLMGKAGAVKEKDPDEAGLTPEAIDQIARTAINDRTALSGYGRSPKMLSKIANRMAEISEGGDINSTRVLAGADRKSLEKMIPQYDAVVAFENNTVQQGKILVDLAKKIDVTGVPVVERWIRSGRQAVAGDEDVTAFNAQLMLFGTEAAKILTNPNLTGVLTDSARHEVSDFLPKSASAGQIERVVNLLENDFHIRRKSIEDQTAAITKRMAERKSAPTGVAAATAGGAGTKVDPKVQAARDSDRGAILRRELQEAQARLAKGDERAQGDIDTLQREITRLPGTRVSGTGLSGGDEKKAAVASFSNEAAATAAAKAGKLKSGDRITINGQTGTWQ